MMKTGQNYDAIIIGSGISGLGAAYALVKRGKKVLIISPEIPLKGESTPASAGILDPFLESASPKHPFFELKKKAFLKLPRQLQAIERESGKKTGYMKTGMLFTALSREDERKLKARMARHQLAGIPIQWLDRSDALRRWPYLDKAIRGVLHYPTLGRVFPAELQKALTRIVLRQGATKVSVKKQVKLFLEQDQVAGVVVDQKKVFASHVINAGGSWADQLGLSKLRFPVFPVRGQVVVVRGKTKNIKQVVHSAGGIYIVPWARGTYLLGSTVENVGFIPAVQKAMLKKIQRDASAMIPELKACQPIQNWAGLRPCSKDHLPLLGKTAIKGYYMAAGYYRSGIVISLYAGELLAEGIFGKGFSNDLKPFSPLRFQRKPK